MTPTPEPRTEAGGVPAEAEDGEGLREALRQAIHDTIYHDMDPKAGFRWYWQTDDGTPNDLADAVMRRLEGASDD